MAGTLGAGLPGRFVLFCFVLFCFVLLFLLLLASLSFNGRSYLCRCHLAAIVVVNGDGKMMFFV